MKILVTGGAGFIGSNFVRYLTGRYPDYEITILDKLTYAGNEENIRDITSLSTVTFVRGDICDEPLVDELTAGATAVVNFAAETHVDRSIHDPSAFVMTNVYGTGVLLAAALRHTVEKFVQISTDEVYGSIETGSFSEEAPLNPTNPYSASKAAADLLALSYFRTYRLPVSVTRSTNVFGPYQYPEKLIPFFISNALERKPLPLYGDGLNVRDWISAQDICEAVMLVLHEGTSGEVYNIAGGNETRNLDIAHGILDALGLPDKLITFVSDRPAHDRRYALDRSKIEALGWTPRRIFKEALVETVQWYRENEGWWRRIKEKQESYAEFVRKQYPSLVSQ